MPHIENIPDKIIVDFASFALTREHAFGEQLRCPLNECNENPPYKKIILNSLKQLLDPPYWDYRLTKRINQWVLQNEHLNNNIPPAIQNKPSENHTSNLPQEIHYWFQVLDLICLLDQIHIVADLEFPIYSEPAAKFSFARILHSELTTLRKLEHPAYPLVEASCRLFLCDLYSSHEKDIHRKTALLNKQISLVPNLLLSCNIFPEARSLLECKLQFSKMNLMLLNEQYSEANRLCFKIFETLDIKPTTITRVEAQIHCLTQLADAPMSSPEIEVYEGLLRRSINHLEKHNHHTERYYHQIIKSRRALAARLLESGRSTEALFQMKKSLQAHQKYFAHLNEPTAHEEIFTQIQILSILLNKGDYDEFEFLKSKFKKNIQEIKKHSYSDELTQRFYDKVSSNTEKITEDTFTDPEQLKDIQQIQSRKRISLQQIESLECSLDEISKWHSLIINPIQGIQNSAELDLHIPLTMLDLSPQFFTPYMINLLEQTSKSRVSMLESACKTLEGFFKTRELTQKSAASIRTLLNLWTLVAVLKKGDHSNILKKLNEAYSNLDHLFRATNVGDIHRLTFCYFSPLIQVTSLWKPSLGNLSYNAHLEKINSYLTDIENFKSSLSDPPDSLRLDWGLARTYNLLANAILSYLQNHPSLPKAVSNKLATHAISFKDKTHFRLAGSKLATDDLFVLKKKLPKQVFDVFEIALSTLSKARGELNFSSNRSCPKQSVNMELCKTRFGTSPSLQNHHDNDNELVELNSSKSQKSISDAYSDYNDALMKVQEKLPGFRQHIQPQESITMGSYLSLKKKTESVLCISNIGGALLIGLGFNGQIDHRIIGDEYTSNILDEIVAYEEAIKAQKHSFSPSASSYIPRFEDIFPACSDHLVSVIFDLVESLGIARNDTISMQIVPDPALSMLPLHAIPSSKHESTLSEIFDVHYAPCLSIATDKREQRKKIEKYTVICPEDPFDDASLHCALAETFGSWNGLDTLPQKLISKHVTIDKVFRALEDSQLLHFSGHLKPAPEDPLGSYLPTQSPPLLSLRRILTELRHQNSGLIILNICRGSLKISASLDEKLKDKPPSSVFSSFEDYDQAIANEHLSFSTAFLLNGAQCVVSTLWDVDDLASALCMWKFSHLFIEGQTKGNVATSLQTATLWLSTEIPSGKNLIDSVLPEFLLTLDSTDPEQKRIIQECREDAEEHASIYPDSPPFAHPRYWAGFVANGSPHFEI